MRPKDGRTRNTNQQKPTQAQQQQQALDDALVQPREAKMCE